MKGNLRYLEHLDLIVDEQFKELDNAEKHSSVYLLNGKQERLVLKEIMQEWINENKINKQG